MIEEATLEIRIQIEARFLLIGKRRVARAVDTLVDQVDHQLLGEVACMKVESALH